MSMKPEYIAAVSATIALLSLIVSMTSVFIAGKASRMNERMFKRQRVIDLYTAWLDIKNIDPANPIAVDVVRGINALGLTATLWHHDIVEHEILFQSYWPSFQALYDSIAATKMVIPKINKMGSDCLTNEIKRAYNEMKANEIAALNRAVTQTTIS
jgi:hypothetical protein